MKQSTLWLALVAGLVCVGCGATTPNSDSDSAASSGNAAPTRESQPPTNGQHPDAPVVQQDVRRLLDAVYSGEVHTVLGLTHPKVIESMGGEALAEAALRSVFSQFESLDMKVESLEFSDAPDFLESESKRFVIVPLKVIFVSRGERVESRNFQLGIQSKGETTWKYLEGSQINSQSVHTLFADFPADYKFPAVSRKKL